MQKILMIIILLLLTPSLCLATETFQTGGTIRSEYNRTISDTISVNELSERVYNRFNILSQDLTLSSISQKLISVFRTELREISYSDFVMAFALRIKKISEYFGINEISTRIYTGIRTTTQQMNINDVVDRLTSISRTSSQFLNINDAVIRMYTALRSTTQPFSLSDSVIRIYTIFPLVLNFLITFLNK